jgi:hypothetical protein
MRGTEGGQGQLGLRDEEEARPESLAIFVRVASVLTLSSCGMLFGERFRVARPGNACNFGVVIELRCFQVWRSSVVADMLTSVERICSSHWLIPGEPSYSLKR